MQVDAISDGQMEWLCDRYGDVNSNGYIDRLIDNRFICINSNCQIVDIQIDRYSQRCLDRRQVDRDKKQQFDYEVNMSSDDYIVQQLERCK